MRQSDIDVIVKQVVARLEQNYILTPKPKSEEPTELPWAGLQTNTLPVTGTFEEERAKRAKELQKLYPPWRGEQQ